MAAGRAKTPGGGPGKNGSRRGSAGCCWAVRLSPAWGGGVVTSLAWDVAVMMPLQYYSFCSFVCVGSPQPLHRKRVCRSPHVYPSGVGGGGGGANADGGTDQWWANLDQAPKDLDTTIFRDLSPTPIP